MVEAVSGDNVNINGGAVVMSMTESKPQYQAQGNRVGSGGVRKKRKCYHCGKPGHIKRECWHFINKSKKVKENQKETKKPDQSNKSKAKKKIVNDGKKPGIINHMMDFSANVSSVAHSYSSSSSSDDEDKDVLMLGMVLRQDSISKSSSWMLDCGSSMHVCVDRNLFSTIKKSKATFKVWTDQITKGIMSGSVMLRVPDTNNDGNVIDVELKDVEFSPAGTVNLMSLGKLENEGWIPSFSPVGVTPRKCWLDSNVEELEFVKNGAHYWLDVTGKLSVEKLAMTTLNADANPLMLWHERLGHLNVPAIKAMVDRKVADGMDIPAELFKKKCVCMTCMSAKRRRMSYKKGTKEKRTKVNYERLMSDTCDMGKFIPGTGDYRYFQLIQDEGFRYKWCYPIKKKSDSNANTMMLIKKLIAQGHRIKTFTRDNGGEFVNNELISFLNVHGIEFVPPHAYTPEENALVENLNGVLVNKTRTAMQAVDMPTALWSEVLQYIVEIDNMSATRALNGRTPFENYVERSLT
ncbi:Hypothetical protein PHPALM_12177 [Phytophthora palmivora]|uniref:Uncharacterized protein n=1 Tax=Phytophthora palmivora TaxID=4796 RepID=A0A2P4Y0D0_9STRA|nr:Hypothetical protein PHPALM_12177 [Phytophthora palmivora]